MQRPLRRLPRRPFRFPAAGNFLQLPFWSQGAAEDIRYLGGSALPEAQVARGRHPAPSAETGILVRRPRPPRGLPSRDPQEPLDLRRFATERPQELRASVVISFPDCISCKRCASSRTALGWRRPGPWRNRSRRCGNGRARSLPDGMPVPPSCAAGVFC